MLYSLHIHEKNSTPLAHQPRPICMGPNLPGPYFRYNQTGHWAKSCPNPRPPTKPCPTCKQWGHWKKGHPQTLPTISWGPPQAQQQWAGNQTQGDPGTPDHGSSDEVRADPAVPELFQWWSPSSRPQVHPIQMDSELRVIGTVAGHKVSFLTDNGAAFSLLTSSKGPLQPSEVAIEGGLRHPFLSPNNLSSPLFLW